MSAGNPSIVDEVVPALRCAVMYWQKSDIVIAREEALYVCGTEGRGGCYVYAVCIRLAY